MRQHEICNVKVLTLNCWGIFFPFVCSKRHERIAAIAKKLSDTDTEYDIVLLQEIWSQSDYELICRKTNHVMPHTHYFHSNMIGSGMCVFSKHPIIETLYHRFPINGHAHRVQHGDWFGGKGVGLCKVLVNDIRVNLFTTHFHAEYSTNNDEYLAHRVIQTFEMAQFIKNTSETCDVVIAGGDFNTRPTDPGYNLMVTSALLKDAWTDQRVKPVDLDAGASSDNPTNSFACKKRLQIFPKGERIDYIFFRANQGYSMDCTKCELTMGRIPGEDYNYSDHEGVTANFEIKRNITAGGPQLDTVKRKECLHKALRIMQSGLIQVHNEKVYFIAYFLVALAVLIMLGFTNPPYGFNIICTLIRIYFTLLLGYSFWVFMVVKASEANAINNSKKDMRNILDQEKHFEKYK